MQTRNPWGPIPGLVRPPPAETPLAEQPNLLELASFEYLGFIVGTALRAMSTGKYRQRQLHRTGCRSTSRLPPTSRFLATGGTPHD